MDRLLPSLSQLALGLGLLAAQAVPRGPAAAQSAEDWGSGPLAIPAATGEPPGPRAAPESPPPRQVLQPPPEFRRPPAPLLPGRRNRVAPDPMSGPPDIRITPGAGVLPQPRKLSPPPPPAALVAPLSPPVVVVPRPVPKTVPRPAPQPLPRRAAPRQPFPSIVESLPPGTIRPLPGEILPGSRSRPPLPELPLRRGMAFAAATALGESQRRGRATTGRAVGVAAAGARHGGGCGVAAAAAAASGTSGGTAGNTGHPDRAPP